MMKSINPSNPTAYPYCPNCSRRVLRLLVPTYLRTMTFLLLIPSKLFKLLANKIAPRLVMLQLSSSPIQNPYSAILCMILSTDLGVSLSNNSKNLRKFNSCKTSFLVKSLFAILSSKLNPCVVAIILRTCSSDILRVCPLALQYDS